MHDLRTIRQINDRAAADLRARDNAVSKLVELILAARDEHPVFAASPPGVPGKDYAVVV